MIEAALRSDATLEPRDIDETHHSSLVNILLKWKLRATENALERRDAQIELQDHHAAKQLPDTPPPNRKRSNPFCESYNSDHLVKKQKVLRIAGVPTGEGDDLNQDFWQGLGGAGPIRPSQLQYYPGKSTVLLNVEELMGPSILQSFCQEGLNIELVVRSVRWTRQADGRPFQSEVEALTIARILHFHFSRAKTMEEGIVAHPWTEIALRRLWAILEVQNLTSGPSPLTRDEALQQVMPSLEVYPDVGIRVPAMRSLVHRHVSAASRARNAVRSLTKKSALQSQGQRKRQEPGGK